MIYITGANGWLGINLLKAIQSGKTEKWGLKNDGIKAFILKGTDKKQIKNISNEIEIVEGDITNQNDIDNLLINSKNDLIFHTVGIIHPLRVKDFYKINVSGTKNLLNACIKVSAKKVVLMSSNSPCGCNSNKLKLFNEKSPYNPYMHYGKSKMAMEEIAKSFFHKGLIDRSISK